MDVELQSSSEILSIGKGTGKMLGRNELSGESWALSSLMDEGLGRLSSQGL